MGVVPHFSLEKPKCDAGLSPHCDLLGDRSRAEFRGNARALGIYQGAF